MTLKDFVEVISAVGTLILSLVALVFSIYAYKRVSLKAEFKRKQLDTVYELVELLQDTILHFEAVGNNSIPNSSSGTMCRFFRLEYSYRKDGFNEYSSAEVFLVCKHPVDELEFIKFSEHPYLPTEIAEIIREFVGYTYHEPVKKSEYKSYAVLGGASLMFDLPLYKVHDNSVYDSFDTFCSKCIQLDRGIHKWLKSVGIDNFNKKALID